MTLHRFFLPTEAFQGDQVSFPDEQSHQIRTVLRLRPEATVIVLDGSGSEAVVRLIEVDRAVRGTVEERRANAAEPHTRLRLYQGLLKGSKLELVLQRCTEIGVSEFVPVLCARSVPAEPGAGKQRRFEAIVREAAEQSGRGLLPTVRPPIPFARAMQEAVGAGPAILLWEGEKTVHLGGLVLEPSSSIGLFVGPEGGFTEEEAGEARRLGVEIVTLGRRILRAETAAMVGSALLLARLGDLG